MATRAFVLIQSARPGPGAAATLAEAVDRRLAAEFERGRLSFSEETQPTVGPFDAVAEIEARNPTAVASVVTALQRLGEVGLTLTLPQVARGDAAVPEGSDPDEVPARETATPQHGGSRIDRPLVD